MKRFSAKQQIEAFKALDTQRENFLKQTKNSTLYDYVRWVSDVSFDEKPLCEADIMVMCVMIYFDLEPLFNAGELRAKVSDCVRLFETGWVRLMIVGGDLGNSDIFRAAAASKRFGELEISDLSTVSQDDPPLQFCACTFHYKDKFSVIAYRGTDSSLAGWKENFMISFTRTTAQTLASEYAGNVITQDRDWYISGHSKGGNLALYASCMLTDEQLAAVRRIFLLDGPGLCPEVLDEALVTRIDPKTTRIIPEFDVVGKLFEPKITDTRIVKSYRQGIVEHSLASWLVDHGDLALAPCGSPSGVWINSVIKSWIEDIPLEERQTVVDELFDALGADGVTDLNQVSPQYMADLIYSLNNQSGTTKRALVDIPRRMLFDDLLENVDGLPADDKDKPLVRFLKNTDLLTAIAVAVFGVLALISRRKLLEIVSLFLVIATALVQVLITVRRIVKNRGSMAGVRERIYITIAMLAVVPVVLLKEGAMFLLGSLILGVAFLVLVYVCGDKASRERRIFMKVLNIVEAVACALLGVSFLVIPRVHVFVYALSIGLALVADALIRFGFLIYQAVRRRIVAKLKRKIAEENRAR